MSGKLKRQASKRRPSYRSRHRRSRGIVLLLVVSLITLFLLIGITFAVVALNYKDAAVKTSQLDQLGDNYEQELDNVFRLLLRDSKSPPAANPGVRSCLTFHSLLYDLYGTDGAAGFVNSVSSENQGQIIHLIARRQGSLPVPYIQPRTGQSFDWDVASEFSLVPDFYNGRVFTFTTGQAAGLSTRVLKYDINTSVMPREYHFWISSFDTSTDIPSAVTVNAQDRFLVNGAPFNGTGFGLEPGAGTITQTVRIGDPTAGNNVLTSVLPHYAGYSRAINTAMGAGPNERVSILGGPDEGYDAPDYNNMLLAMVPANVAAGGLPIFPSLHRPDLLNFFLFGTGASVDCGDLRRASIFRPMPWDHPNFTGSNSNFAIASGTAMWAPGTDMAPGRAMVDDDGDGTTDNPSELGAPGSDDVVINDGGLKNALVNGPWDVDNDSDGIADSIWVDPGLPVLLAPNGRRYKRLFAIMVKDLDGRVNLNTASNLQLVPPAMGTNVNRADANLVSTYFAGQAINSTTPVVLPRGFGFGPAEIDFAHIFSKNSAVCQAIMQSRYGARTATSGAGVDQASDYFWYTKSFGLPRYFDDSSTTNPFGNGYASPADLFGRGTIALDHFGMPKYAIPDAGGTYTQTGGTTTSYEQFDPPYEMQVDPRKARNDQPFTAAELERIVRHNDGDASSLNRRLADLAGNYFTAAGNSRIRNSVTTLSSHIPVPATPGLSTMQEATTPIPTWSSSSGTTGLPAGYASLPYLFAKKFPVTNAQQFRQLVAWEIRQGRPFNLNRPFGNGKHDPTTADSNAGFGVVDDPSEWLLGFAAANPPENGIYNTNCEKLADSTGAFTIPFWHRGDEPLPYAGSLGPFNPDPRQLYCRHLYCLMMMLLPQSFDLGELDAMNNLVTYQRDNTTDVNIGRPAYARKIAQYVVNVVDFRDPDSINTAFEYDINPFDGWNVDGVLTTDENSAAGAVRGIVWGTERPELLLTESLCWHDRRTEDLGSDSSGKKTTDPTQPDEDFDSRLRPYGATFIELYNPWFSADGRDIKPVELYSNTGNPATNGVNLARVAPGGAPVWRILVVAGNSNNSTLDPDAANATVAMATNPNPLPEKIPNTDVVRSIYFADPTALVSAGANHGSPYYTNIPFAPVLPGRYAVVGSSGITQSDGGGGANKYVSVIGRQNPTPDPTTTRRIELAPNTDPNVANQVRVIDNVTAGQNDVTFVQAANAVAVVINRRCLGGGAMSDQDRSLSLTEPVNGYPTVADPNWMPGQADGVGDNDGEFMPPRDEPLDMTRTDTEANTVWWASDGTGLLIPSGTKPAFRTLHLQRLANPLLAWNVDTNPYLTVDSSSVDLQAFNGVTNGTTEKAGSMDQNAITTNFQTFQRGGSFAAPGNTQTTLYPSIPTIPAPWGSFDSQRLLWPRQAPHGAPAANSPDETTLNPALTVQHFFKYPLLHTLGYLNSRYQPHFRTSDAPAPGPYVAPNSAPGSPNTNTFPWLTFLNRPFTSPAELLQVPMRSQSQLLRIANNNIGQAGATTGPYSLAAEPFNFLLNPFYSQAGGGGGGPTHFCRLFDYVETRSPFTDVEKWFNPNQTTIQYVYGNPALPGGHFGGYQTTAGMTTLIQHDGSAADAYRPPFNYLSNFRDPGRININTAFDGTGGQNQILEAAFNQSSTNRMDSTGFRDTVQRSLRGDGQTDFTPSNRPSMFSNPVRAAELASVMPNSSTPMFDMRQARSADATMFRPNPNAGGGPPAPLFSYTSNSAHEETQRNPYFKYQGLQNVWNKVTNQSNCYAVWITVGYFEADWVGATSAVYPDGYRLGQEIGADAGEIKRHRAFYILDRSIPVGFEPGEDHNVDKCVLLRRIIE